MGLITLFTTAFIVGLSGAMTPGPLLTITISETARQGFKAGPLIVLGHAILELILVLVLIAGLATYLTNTKIYQAITISGGIFLLYMGAKIVIDIIKGNLSFPLTNGRTEEKNEPSNTNTSNHGMNHTEESISLLNKQLNPILAGALISLFNPVWLIWWATIGLSYITFSLKSGIPGITFFFSGHILADLTWYGLVAAAVVAGRKFLNNYIYQSILLLCGVFLFGLGLYFISIGVKIC